ncbi:hypothetical protein OH809_43805 (plasmid) [Streptomyces sp. NBC_00873]|uniref:hypothetical protein n=1 Tax=unclassified Streptomyces TaxID=2593676 RepID=UPI002F91B512|nr:hypothetical protein OH809_43805 [Streptomyces sp. NBC_00873]WTA49193.1 hypothetical protein OH821_44695 [Streptomyces sp. NBC_00842]
MRTLLRYLLDQRELRDHAAFLPHFKQAAGELAEFEGNPAIATLAPAKATFEGWYYGNRRPQRESRRVLVRLLGYSIDQLWTEVPDGAVPAFPTLIGTSRAEGQAGPGLTMHEMKRTGAMAARRAMDFALGAERNQVGDEALGFLQDEVARIVELYPRIPLAEIWDDLANAQEDTFRILEGGRARPSQLRDLNFMATVLSFLMAKGSHDMGESKVALQQARVAAFCAKEAEHTGLMALVDGLKSLISYWAGRPEDALHYAQQGATRAPNLRGTVSVWLPGLEARAAALLGDEEAVRAANQKSEVLREQVVPDDLDALGGLLTYPELKQLYYMVESEVLLGHGDSQLAARAEEAVRGFSDREQSHWAFGDLAGSQCNLALVRLYAEDLDGAATAIRPVLDLTPGLRNNGIVRSAERVRYALGRNPVRSTALAGDLRAEIAMYEPSRPALPR